MSPSSLKPTIIDPEIAGAYRWCHVVVTVITHLTWLTCRLRGDCTSNSKCIALTFFAKETTTHATLPTRTAFIAVPNASPPYVGFRWNVGSNYAQTCRQLLGARQRGFFQIEVFLPCVDTPLKPQWSVFKASSGVPFPNPRAVLKTAIGLQCIFKRKNGRFRIVPISASLAALRAAKWLRQSQEKSAGLGNGPRPFKKRLIMDGGERHCCVEDRSQSGQPAHRQRCAQGQVGDLICPSRRRSIQRPDARCSAVSECHHITRCSGDMELCSIMGQGLCNAHAVTPITELACPFRS